VLGGRYLGAANADLERMIADTSAGVRQQVQDQFSSAGRTGSGANQAALARALASTNAGLRFNQMEAERQRMGQAAALAPSLEAARYAGQDQYLQLAQAAAGLPMSAAQGYAGSLGSLLGGYNTQTSVQKQSLGSLLAQAAGTAASVYGAGGFR